MNLLGPFRALTRSWAGKLRRWRTAALLGILAAASAVVACVFVFAALYLFLASAVAPWLAAAATAGVALCLAALFALAARARASRSQDRGRTAAPTEPRAESASGAGSALGEALRVNNASGTDLVVNTLVAGIVLGMGGRPGTKRRRASERQL